MSQRRTFIKQGVLGLTAASLLPNSLFAATKTKNLGLQLYSLRETLPGDVKGTLEKVAKIGYKEVETYGYSPGEAFWGTSLKDFNKLLKDNGLSSPSGHYGLDPYLKSGNIDDLAPTLEVANTLNQKYVIIPYLGDDLRSSKDDYLHLAEQMNKAGDHCKDAGLRLAYHNHDFEFDTYEGTSGLEILLDHTDKELVDFEMDIFWVAFSGIKPADLFNKYPQRFPLWHVKDMSKSNKEENTEVGAGLIDYQEIFKSMKQSGAEHLIVEQENFDMEAYKSLKQSYNYIKNDLL